MYKQTKSAKGETFLKSAKSQINHSSPMSNSAWCDLNSKGDTFKLHDVCHPSCKFRSKLLLHQTKFSWKDLDLKKL